MWNGETITKDEAKARDETGAITNCDTGDETNTVTDLGLIKPPQLSLPSLFGSHTLLLQIKLYYSTLYNTILSCPYFVNKVIKYIPTILQHCQYYFYNTLLLLSYWQSDFS